jgi:mannose-1-phosphate guanylyltransferase/phosphomannomutase
MAARLGAAYGAYLPRGSVVTINRDPHRSPRMIKRAIMSGLPSAGIHVLDLQQVPLPVARMYSRTVGAAGGVHVRLSPFDPRVVDIRLFDGNGITLSKDVERAIERVFFREDFRRVYLDEIGIFSYAQNVVSTYREGYLKALNVPAVRKRRFRVVVDYASATTSQVLPDLLNDLNCEVVGLNARVDESRLSIPEDELRRGIDQLATICRALKVDLGVRLDPAGEKVYVVDDSGAVVPHLTVTAAMADLALGQAPGGTLVVTVSAPTAFDEIAARYGGTVVRTKQGLSDLMHYVSKQPALLAADSLGDFIFPSFHFGPDGLMAIGKMLEMLALREMSLSQVVAGLPKYHLEQLAVSCPREAKGVVMRRLHEQYASQRSDATDGLKVWFSDRQWVLVLPDPDRPLFHVYAEGESELVARELAQRYARIIEGLRG